MNFGIIGIDSVIEFGNKIASFPIFSTLTLAPEGRLLPVEERV